MLVEVAYKMVLDDTLVAIEVVMVVVVPYKYKNFLFDSQQLFVHSMNLTV